MHNKVNQRERQRCKTKKSIDQHQRKTSMQDKGASQGSKTREQGIGFESTRKTRGKTGVQDK